VACHLRHLPKIGPATAIWHGRVDGLCQSADYFEQAGESDSCHAALAKSADEVVGACGER
jgi:hypothetical protein